MTPELEHIEIYNGSEITSDHSLAATRMGEFVRQMAINYYQTLETKILDLEKEVHNKDLIIQEKENIIQSQRDQIEMLKSMLAGRIGQMPSVTSHENVVNQKYPVCTFDSIIQTDVNIEAFKNDLHKKIDGKKGKSVAVVLRKALKEVLITRLPTEAEYKSEFVLHGRWRSISQYFPGNQLGENKATQEAVNKITFSGNMHINTST